MAYGDFEIVEALVFKPSQFPSDLSKAFQVDKAYAIKYDAEKIDSEEAIIFESLDSNIYLQVEFDSRVLNVKMKPVDLPKMRIPLNHYVNVYIVS